MENDEVKQIAYDLINADFDWRICHEDSRNGSLVQLSPEYANYLAIYILAGIEKRKTK